MTESSTSGATTVDTIVVDTYSSSSYLYAVFSCHDITMTESSTSGATTVDTIVVDTYSSISYLYAVFSFHRHVFV